MLLCHLVVQRERPLLSSGMGLVQGAWALDNPLTRPGLDWARNPPVSFALDLAQSKSGIGDPFSIGRRDTC